MEVVDIWTKLKLQIDNLKLLNEQQKTGLDVSRSAYWQFEYLNQLLVGLEEHLGVDKVRGQFLSED